MKGIKTFVDNLANRINQPHYLEIELRKVFNAGVQYGLAKGWQPIETAPIDGTRVLSYNAHGDFQEVVLYGKHGWTNQDETELYQPTHWMPLPETP